MGANIFISDAVQPSAPAALSFSFLRTVLRLSPMMTRKGRWAGGSGASSGSCGGSVVVAVVAVVVACVVLIVVAGFFFSGGGCCRCGGRVSLWRDCGCTCPSHRSAQ